MRRIAFSTDAIARVHFRTALTRMQKHKIEAVELSALRIDQLAPLIEALPLLDLHQFTYVSIHAPGRFPQDLEPWPTVQLGELAAELRGFFESLPEARFCFDIGHARRIDPTMSELNTASRHDPISLNAVMAFNAIAGTIPDEIPIILQSLIDQGQSSIATEAMRAREALASVAV